MNKIIFVFLIIILIPGRFLYAQPAPNFPSGITPEVRVQIEKLNSQDPVERVKAARRLGEIGDAQAIEALAAALKDRKSSVQENAQIALEKIMHRMKDSQAVEPLSKLLNHEDPVIRNMALEALKEIPDQRVPRLLTVALKEQNAGIRKSAAEALRKIGKPSVEPLIKTLSEDDINIRITAIIILGDIRDARAVEPLIEALAYKTQKPSLEEAKVRLEASNALGKIGDPRAVRPLIALLKDEDIHIRDSAKEAINEIGSPSVEYLIEALQEDNINVLITSAKILGDMKDVRAVAPLIILLTSEPAVNSWLLRTEIARALGKIKDPRAIGPLEQLSNERITPVKDSAIWALEEIKGRDLKKQ